MAIVDLDWNEWRARQDDAQLPIVCLRPDAQDYAKAAFVAGKSIGRRRADLTPRLGPDRPSDAVIPFVQATAPEKIYMCVSDDAYDADKVFPDGHAEICWADDEAIDVCVPYVRADLAAAPPDEAPAELGEDVDRVAKVMASARLNWSDLLPSEQNQYRDLARKVIGVLAAAPAAPAITAPLGNWRLGATLYDAVPAAPAEGVIVHSVIDGVGTFDCPATIKPGDTLYTTPRVTGGREDAE